MLCEIEKLLVQALFTAKEVPLNFDEDIVAAPDVDQLLCALLAACATQQRHESGGKFCQFIPVNCAAPFLAPQMSLGEQLAQILITILRLHQHGQDTAVSHRQFAADNWSHVLLSRRDGKSLRAVNAIAIQQCYRRQLEFCGNLGDVLRR